MTTARTSHRGRRYTFMWLALLLLLGGSVRVGFWDPGGGSDQSRYVTYAASLARGERLQTLDHAAARFSYELLLAAWMRVFGVNTLVCSSLGIGLFAATSIILFCFARRLADDESALLAVFLYAFLPADILASTRDLPDQAMTLAALSAALVFLIAAQQRSRRSLLLLSFVCGSLLGLGVSLKEYAFCAGIAFAVYLALAKRSPGFLVCSFSAMAMGGLLVLACESLALALWTGDALYRFHAVAQVYDSGGTWENTPTLGKLTFYLRVAANSRGDFGIHGYVMLAAVLLGLNRRNRVLMFPVIWCALFGLYLSVGSASLRRYVLVPQEARYFLPVMVMGCAIAGMEWRELACRLTLKPIVSLAAAAVFVVLSLGAASYTVPIEPEALVQVNEQLANMPDGDRHRIVVPPNFVKCQALEHKDMASRFAQINPSDFSPEELAEKLAGRGLVIPDGWCCRYKYPLEERKYVPFFEVEELYGPAWPPYKRWIGLGEQRRRIGVVYWPKVHEIGQRAGRG